MAHVEIIFKTTGPELNDILVARLAEINYDGFEEERNTLKAYIVDEHFDQGKLDELCEGLGATYIRNAIPETNWNQLWESNFEPVRVGDFCGMRAYFHEAYADVQYEIVITPKMSFGTGHHPTTYMMIQQMEDIQFTGKRVFDFGTGTAVLAILAKKMGAAEVLAIDNDEWSITNAIENMANNKVDFEIRMAEAPEQGLKFDLILANITRNVITANFEALVKAMSPDGLLILSGLLQDDEPQIMELASGYPIELVQKIERKSWISLKFRLREVE